jgi:hypothetical protein
VVDDSHGAFFCHGVYSGVNDDFNDSICVFVNGGVNDC